LPGRPGANTLTAAASTSGLIAQGVAASGLDLGEVKEYRSLAAIEADGVTESYDTVNKVLVWYHAKEFYRRAPGARLWVMLVDNQVTGGEPTVPMEAIVDKEMPYAAKVIRQAKGKIYQLTVAINPVAGYAQTTLDGLDSQVAVALPKAKGLVDWATETNRPCAVILEGRGYSGVSTDAQGLRDIPNLQADGVGICIGQDWGFAESLDESQRYHACVGTLLGVIASLPVNRNPGEVETQDLVDEVEGDFLITGLSSHQQAIDVEEALNELDEKGYIYVFSYTDYDGAFFNNDHCATPIIVDSDRTHNRHQLSMHRVYAKAARRLRAALLPKVKSTQRIDRATGKLPLGTVKAFEAIGNEELLEMEGDGEISGGATYIDPNSDLSTVPRVLKVDFNIVFTGTIDRIEGTIALSERLNS